MSIKDDIAKLTRIPPQGEFNFVPRDKSDVNNSNRKKIKPVRPKGHGKKLLDFYTEFGSSNDEQNNTDFKKDEGTSFHKIAALNSNAHNNSVIEEHIRQKQRKAEEAKSKAGSNDNRCVDVSSSSSLQSKRSEPDSYKSLTSNNSKVESVHHGLRKSRYTKNGVIIGLLNSNTITLRDLGLSDNETSVKSEVQRSKEGDKNDLQNNGNENVNYVEMPHPEDSEVTVNRLQHYGTRNCPDIDFTVERLGKKTTVTAKDYLMSVTDEDFAFRKPNA